MTHTHTWYSRVCNADNEMNYSMNVPNVAACFSCGFLLICNCTIYYQLAVEEQFYCCEHCDIPWISLKIQSFCCCGYRKESIYRTRKSSGELMLFVHPHVHCLSFVSFVMWLVLRYLFLISLLYYFYCFSYVERWWIEFKFSRLLYGLPCIMNSQCVLHGGRRRIAAKFGDHQPLITVHAENEGFEHIANY